MIKKISLATLLTLSSLSASDTVKPMLQMGYDWGGTTLRVVKHDTLFYGRDVDKIRAGQGLSFEAGAAISNDDNAIGGIAQIQYRATNAFSLGVKATFIEYDLINSLPGVEEAKTVDGNSIGIVFNYTFGNERSRFR